jgi:alpha-beta hydrolase superfamily lysophospholipase
MQADTFSWQTPDGLNIHALHWKQENPVAVVGFVHGMGEHAARYAHLAEAFAQKSMACMAYDRRGHGRSDGQRGHTPSYQAFIQEIKTLIEQLRRVYGNKPVYLYGHSMGGNLVLNYLLREEVKVQGIIASSPWIELSFKPSPIKVQGGKLVRSLLPKLSMKNELNPEFLSRDQAAVEAYVNDPLVHDKITPNTGVFMLEQARYLNEYSGDIDTPLLIFHGTDDQILSHDAARRFAERLNGPVTFKSWEGGYHELHHDINQEEVIRYILDWLSAQLKNAG